MRDDAYTIEPDHAAVCAVELTTEVWAPASGKNPAMVKTRHAGNMVHHTDDRKGLAVKYDWLMEICNEFRLSKS